MLRPGCLYPPDEIRTRTAKLLSELGAGEASRQLGVSKVTVLGIAAGAPITKGTVAITSAALGIAQSPATRSRA